MRSRSSGWPLPCSRPLPPLGEDPHAAKPDRTAQPEFIPQSVSFVSPRLGWAWGPAAWPTAATAPGVLARTTDGGRIWAVVGPAALRYALPAPGDPRADSAVSFVDRRHGYLFGGVLLATTDGGRTWRLIPTRGPVIDVEASAGRAYAEALGCPTCQTAYLYRIRDGRLWRIGPPLPGGRAQLVVRGRAVYLLDAYDAIGEPVPMWASQDAGLAWRRLTVPCTWLGADAALAAWSASGLALACGSQPGAGNQAKTFYSSTDGGVHWRITSRIGFAPGAGFTPGYVLSLAAPTARTWVLGEARGGIMVSHDGGRSWHWPTFSGATASVEGFGSVSFSDATHGVAVPWTLNGDVLAFTADGGRRWREVSSGS